MKEKIKKINWEQELWHYTSKEEREIMQLITELKNKQDEIIDKMNEFLKNVQ